VRTGVAKLRVLASSAPRLDARVVPTIAEPPDGQLGVVVVRTAVVPLLNQERAE
jgi:hypothetical protein